MKATYSLLRYSLGFILLALVCFVSDVKYPRVLSFICIWYCIPYPNPRRFPENSWCEAFFEDLFICFPLCPVFMHFFNGWGHPCSWILLIIWILREEIPLKEERSSEDERRRNCSSRKWAEGYKGSILGCCALHIFVGQGLHDIVHLLVEPIIICT